MAGPLDLIETYIRLFPELLFTDLYIGQKIKGTLLQIAIILLDISIIDNENNVIDESLAGKVIQLHIELFPELLTQTLEEIRLSLPETRKEKSIRE